jgi:hypothetical protein
VRLALLQFSYWNGGFDAPLFLAYSNGTVIFQRAREKAHRSGYGTVQYAGTGLDSVLAGLGMDSALFHLDTLYDYAPGVTDQHSFFLLIPRDTGFRLIRVRAGWGEHGKLRADVPASFARLYYGMRGFSPVGATLWSPDSIQVAIWPYEYAPDGPPLAWPANWPSLKDPRWERHDDQFVNEVWTIHLPFKDAGALDSIFALQKEKQAIGMGGRKWAMTYRWVFPDEEDWRWVSRHLEY